MLLKPKEAWKMMACEKQEDKRVSPMMAYLFSTSSSVLPLHANQFDSTVFTFTLQKQNEET